MCRNKAEQNYTTTKQEGLAKVSNVKKFKNYLLPNKSVSCVDHQDSLYLVHKPCLMEHITRWMLFLPEFDFTIIVKKGNTHVLVDHMSRIPNGEAPPGVEDNLPNGLLIMLDLVSKWAEEICITLMSYPHKYP